MSLSRRTLLRASALTLLSGCARPLVADARGPSSLPSETYRPGSREYEALRRGFNMAYDDVRPTLITLPRTDEDVARVLEACRRQGLPLHLRSGGHSFEDTNTGPGVLMDLRHRKRVQVDPRRRLVTAEAGAKLGAVVTALAPHRLAIPTGSCPSVGVTGLTLGGGYGFLSRKLGLTCDALVEAELFDARARRWTASAQQNPELFWALRGGGGGNFGVVTRLTFRARPVPATATVLRARVRAADRLDFLTTWQSWIPSGPDDLTPLVYLAATRDGLDGPVVLAQHLGGVQEAERALAPFMPFLDAPELKEMPMLAAAEFFGGALDAPMRPVRFKSKSHFFNQALGRDEWSALLTKLDVPVDGVVAVMLDPWQGAIARVAADDTAFAHRDALLSIQYRADWDTPEQRASCVARLADLYASMAPRSSGAYVNYSDKDLTAAHRAYYRDNLERLRDVKRRFDGEGFFRHALSL